MDYNFENLDLTGVKPTSVPMRTINVVIDPEVLVDGYADAFVKECRRVNPRRFEQVELSQDEMREYCRYLLSQRIACIYNECKEWRLLKNLYIPVFIQYAMSLVGEVIIRDHGIKLMPVLNDVKELTFEEALVISDKIGMFENELHMRKDAMPRGKEGDLDTMSCALIAGYVCSMNEVKHPVSTYIAAFMGFKLQEEEAFRVLYGVQYDDLEFIRAAMTNNHVVMGNVSEN